MGASAIIFYLLASFILGTALLAVTTGKIVRSAIWLLFSLTGIAGLYFWLQMDFIAAVQIIVYVGGIVVLIIFSIFLTQRSGQEMPKPAGGRIFFSALAVVAGFVLTWLMIHRYEFRPSTRPAVDTGVANIGAQLLSMTKHGYVLPFEVVSLLLLAAMIGCIVIALKIKPAKKQIP
jgi:NADH-quinone oxidoreductase subunit J